MDQSVQHIQGTEVMLAKRELPAAVRLCGKMQMLDRLLCLLHASGHKVVLLSAAIQPILNGQSVAGARPVHSYPAQMCAAVLTLGLAASKQGLTVPLRPYCRC